MEKWKETDNFPENYCKIDAFVILEIFHVLCHVSVIRC